MSLACDEADVARIARAHLNRETQVPRDGGVLLVETDPSETVRWRFVDRRPSCSARQPTIIDCRWHASTGVMWIGEVHVAPALRGRGLGRRLVAAAEAVATELSAHCVYVFPLVSAQVFWLRLGYREHRRMARVMVKELGESCLSPASPRSPKEAPIWKRRLVLMAVSAFVADSSFVHSFSRGDAPGAWGQPACG